MGTATTPMTTMNVDEYDKLVELTSRAEELALERLTPYLDATGGKGPGRSPKWGTFDRVIFHDLSRTGRMPSMDVEVIYTDWERDPSSWYMPAKALWDLEGAIRDARQAAIDAGGLAAKAEAEAARKRAASAEARERAELKRLKAKYEGADDMPALG